MFLGAGVLFLLEGVAENGAFQRELWWAGITVILSLLGIVAARLGRDPAGARALLGLAAATIPAHFAQVGAQILDYDVDGIGTLPGVVAGCVVLVLIAPPLSIGISALVRGRGALLTLILFLFSCPLLLPTRDGDLAAGASVLEILVLLWLELRVFRNDPRMKTFEGSAARAMLLAPPAILLLRNAFHPATTSWIAAVFIVPSMVLLALPHVTRVRAGLGHSMQYLAVIGLLVGCGHMGAELADANLALLGLVLSVVLLLGARAFLGEPEALERVGTAVFALSSIAACVWPTMAYGLLAVPVGVLCAVAAHRARSLPLLAVSLVAIACGVIGQLVPFIHVPTHDRWLVVAIAALALLVLASIVERNRGRLERQWSLLATHFAVCPAPPEEPPRGPDVESGAAHTGSAGGPSGGPFREADPG